MKSLAIDGFLPYPNVVRGWVSRQNFYDCEDYSKLIGSHTSWPGTRTEHIMDLDRDYANVVLSDFSKIIQANYSKESMSIRSYFQSCLKSDGDSWIHQDNDVDIAAVLYLSPNAPTNSGTSLYKCKDISKWSNLDINTMKQINTLERRDFYENLFETVDVFGNVYNRLIIYPGNVFHKSNNYFGDVRENGRLTQVFFVKFEK
jgi:hypothetical protein